MSQNQTKPGGTARTVGAAGGGLLAVAVLLSACASGSGDPTAEGQALRPDELAATPAPVPAMGSMAPAPLPIYTVGDSYTFDNPEETWTVAGFDEKGRLVWRSSLGAERISSIDPILPSLRHMSPDGRGITRIINRDNELFPLRLGARTRFTEAAGMDEPPYSQSYKWSCLVAREDTVAVPAGQFQAYEVVCDRDDGLQAISAYAPDLGYVVQRSVTAEGQEPEIRRLIAYATGQGMSSAPASLPRDPGEAAGPALATGGMPAGTGDGGLGEGPAPAVQASPLAAPAMATSARPPAALPAPSPAPSATMAATPTPAAPRVAAPAPGAAGTTGLQLAAYRSQAVAEEGWRKMQAAYGALLDGLSPVVRQVDIPGKGTYYRLFAVPVDQGRATTLCQEIADLRNHCNVQPLE